MNIISNIITCNPNPQTNSPQWSLVHKRIILLNSKLTANVHFWVNYPFKVLVSGTSVSYSPTKIHFHKYNISIRLITIFVVDWTIIPQMTTWLVAFLPVVSILAIKQRWMDLGSVCTHPASMWLKSRMRSTLYTCLSKVSKGLINILMIPP